MNLNGFFDRIERVVIIKGTYNGWFLRIFVLILLRFGFDYQETISIIALIIK